MSSAVRIVKRKSQWATTVGSGPKRHMRAKKSETWSSVMDAAMAARRAEKAEETKR